MVMRRVLLALLVVVGLAAVSAASAAPTKYIVFTAQAPGGGAEQIYRTTLSGKGLKQLTKTTYASVAPAFAPDGKHIAFVTLGSGIFTMSPDGTSVHRLTSNGRDSFPTWSPDGKQIAFLRPSANGWGVYVMSATGKGARRLPQAPSAGRPTWNTRGLFIPTGGDLGKIDAKTGRLEKLYGAQIDAAVGADETAVAPDVSSLVFVGARKPVPGDKGCGEGVACPVFALYIQNLAKHKAPTILVRDTGPASYSPDGKRLAFVTEKRMELWTLATGKFTSFKAGKLLLANDTPPAWQP
ncbi:MAG: PD40 domain-containing protein [Actinobacteria bacterium]|nr:PD40 domain-containing protein [Actinomycetota bacterium]MBV8480659.1 PD40 domain-containing protein [Actinomycetota bacterium]